LSASSQSRDQQTPANVGDARSILDRMVWRATLALTWEYLWPRFMALLCLAGVFVIVSWLGLWINVPRWGRIAGLLIFGVVLAALLFPLRSFRLPSRSLCLARVDRDSGLAHRPATTLDDQLADSNSAPETRALWRVHLRRASSAAAALKVAMPAPKVPLQDRFAVRAGILTLVFATAFVAGPEKYPRLTAAFDWRTEGSVSQGFRMDAWIDPPAYTGRPPLLLRAKTTDGVTSAIAQTARAPAGSVVIVRASAGAGVSAEVKGGLQAPKRPKQQSKPVDGQNSSSPLSPATPIRANGSSNGSSDDKINRWVLSNDGQLVLRRLGRIVATYTIISIPDKPPAIKLVGEPRRNIRGTLTLRYEIKDDYGVLSAEAVFSAPRINGRTMSGRTLYEPPKMILGLPAASRGAGQAETTKDLSEHPWAGAQVKMVLLARDEGGNTGSSQSRHIVLPKKIFVKPLARALVEQRLKLVLAPDDRKPVEAAFDALMIAPEEFGTDPGTYLGLYTIRKRLETAQSDEHLKDIAKLIWEMALRLEEGDLTDAQRALRAAQQALREALQRGASEEEIKRLMQNLRAAMDRFLREFAQQQLRNQSNRNMRNQDQLSRNQMLSSRDLRNMLDQLERMARSGKMADAQRMLDQLQRMLENLRSARRSQQGNSMSRQMRRSLNQLDQMMREQQRLRDRTFREGQRPNGSRPGQRKQLQQGQGQLRQQLERMLRQMERFGVQTPKGLGQAQREMQGAEGQIGKGQRGMGPATDAQRRALEGLRQGAQSLARQMQRQRGRGNQAGQGDPFGRAARDSANPDPLGREQHHRGDNNRSLYDPPGADSARRAQRILEELRRRLSDPARPTIELDYLERLLKRY